MYRKRTSNSFTPVWSSANLNGTVDKPDYWGQWSRLVINIISIKAVRKIGVSEEQRSQNVRARTNAHITLMHAHTKWAWWFGSLSVALVVIKFLFVVPPTGVRVPWTGPELRGGGRRGRPVERNALLQSNCPPIHLRHSHTGLGNRRDRTVGSVHCCACL